MSLFTDHPRKVGETYFEHLRMASSFGIPMIAAGIGCVMHGIFPFLCERTGSNTVRRLHDRMVTKRAALIDAGEQDYAIDWCI